MNRSQFLGSLFMAAAYYSMPKLIRNGVPPDDLPGIEGKPFKIKLKKGWFENGDILCLGTDPAKSDSHYMYRKTADGSVELISVTNESHKFKYIEVEEVDADKALDSIHDKVHKLCSAYMNFDLKPYGNIAIIDKQHYEAAIDQLK